MTEPTSGIDWTAVRQRLADGERALARGFDDDPVRRGEILEARAKSLARRSLGRASVQVSTTHVLVFRVGEERCAVPLRALASIVAWRPLGAVAGGDGTLLGTLYERGEVWSIYELAAVLGLPGGGEVLPTTRLLLLRGTRRLIGFRVDGVEQVRGVQEEELSGLTGRRASIATAALRGITADALLVLSAEALGDHHHGREGR